MLVITGFVIGAIAMLAFIKWYDWYTNLVVQDKMKTSSKNSLDKENEDV